MARAETEIVHECMKAASQCGARVMKNVRGMFRQAFSEDRIMAGLLAPGASDLIGWTRDGKFVALECKTATGRATPEQLNFIEQVKKSGGIAGVVRCGEDVIKLLQG